MTAQTKFQGTATAIVTPFKKDGSIDEAALRRFVDFQISGGVEALVPVGTTGENPTLNANEQKRVIEIVIEQANKRVKIFAGAGSNNTAEVIEKTRFAKKAGADAALVVGPYYNRPTQNGYFQHFSAVANAVDIPLIIYNVPGRTGGNIEAATMLRMAEEIPHVMMVKEASGNLAQIMEIARNMPKHFSLLSGDDSLAYSIIALGGDGCISVVSNEVPKEYSNLLRLCLKGNWTEALQLHYRLLPLMHVNFIESSPTPVKTALAMMGMMEETLRLPLVPLTEPSRVKLKNALAELKLV
ncbi:MAG: 4-hydroxy-tetrahydrodipicolinate synthase [Bacteroidota bacterium]|jgi:4-hydroxy-tetrahydrodipicolinate synthase